MSTYHLEVAGLSRELPICQISDQLSIAAFIMLGDPELCVASAKALLEKCPEFDVLLTAETKGIPLAHEMARQSGKRYVVARKGENQAELDAMNGKRVLIVDDVISTGGSMHALEALVARSQCQVVAEAAVLAEGDAAKRKDIIFLAPLPLFFH